MRIRVVAAAALAAALMGSVISSDDDGTAPPLGTVPAPEMTLKRLITLHQAAVHDPAIDTLREHWTTESSGLTGTHDFIQRKKDFRGDTNLAGLHSAEGSLAGKAWHQNANGEVVVESGIHQRDLVDQRALAAGSPGVTLIGKLPEARAYIVRVNPPDGRLEYVYFDQTTSRISQVDEATDGTRYITTYDDYRTTEGVTRPWHVHHLTARTAVERDQKLVAFTVNAPVMDAELAVPPSTTPVKAPNAIATLPAKINSDRIILRTEIGGKPVNLQLDSGADGIVIDSDVLKALHIDMLGATTATMAGNYRLSHARVPHIGIGPVSLDNVMVDAVPFVQFADETTPVAGLIGFDFIEGVVLHINYAAGTVEAIDPAAFVPPTDASVVPIALDDNVPIVVAKIGATTGTHFIVDTGADRSTLFSTFVQAHPNDTADQGLGTQQRNADPFETVFYGVGGQVTYRSTQVGPFTFGGHTFAKWLFDATYGAASFELEDYDGLIGQEVLRYFDVYLDYAHQRIYLQPNDRYRSRFGN